MILLLAGCLEKADESAAARLSKFKERNDEPVVAAIDRYQRRLSANGKMPDGALLQAKEQYDAMLLGQFGAGVWPSSWAWTGPGNIGGRLRPIVIQPSDPNVIYVGSASGGVWKTIDGGQNWFPLDDFLPSLCVGDMVMHPEDPATLFAGTGEGFFEALEGSSNTAAVRGAGIFKTVDGGTNWNQIPSTNHPGFDFVNRLEFNPADSSVMLAATNSGIWRSTDEGVTWDLQFDCHALDIKFNPNDPSQVVAGCHDEGPFFSTDGGKTWELASGAAGHRQEVFWSESSAETVYAAVSSGGFIKIWRSTDGGQTWVLRTSGNGITTYEGYNNTLWVDPTNPSFLVVGGVYLYRSTDGGVSLAQRFNAAHADMHRIVPHPAFDGVANKTVYFATDGGIWRTSDVYGTAVVDLNNNLGVTQFYGAGINPANGKIIAGAQDNGTLFYSGDPQNWIPVAGGDGGYCAADPVDANYYYGEIQRALIFRSANGGQSASYIYNGASPIQDAGSSTASNFIPFFLLDPNQPARMLVGCERLWRSNNVKASQPAWTSIKPSIRPPGDGAGSDPGNAHFAPNSPWNISTMAVSEGEADVIWVGHNDGSVFLSTNGTAAAPDWTRVDENDAGLPDRWVSTIVIDREDQNHVYIAFMGWEDDNLWETRNGGMTWQEISGTGTMSIPYAPISALALHRLHPGWLYVGTDIGVFSSGDNGQSWSTSTDGPGTVPVEQLLWRNDNNLMGVTHGRGVYLAQVQDPRPITDLAFSYGLLTGGGIPELLSSDNQKLVCRSTLNPSTQRVTVEPVLGLTATAGTPSLIDVVVESRIFRVSQTTTTVRLRNWSTGLFDDVGAYQSGQADSVKAVTGIDATNHVRASDGRIELALSETSPSSPPLQRFQTSIDRINVFVR